FWPTSPLSLTLYQGYGLGRALVDALGPHYDKPLHFIGHSLGTIVNAHCANYLHGDAGKNPFPPYYWGKTHMTLFDEAEIANFQSSILNFFGASYEIYLPLPAHYRW